MQMPVSLSRVKITMLTSNNASPFTKQKFEKPYLLSSFVNV